MSCPCSCHTKPGSKGMCICCPDGGVTKFMEPPTAEDKSADLLKTLFKKEPQCPAS